MCGGGGNVEDDSLEVAQLQQQQAEQARQRQEAEDRKNQLAFDNSLSTSYEQAVRDAADFFETQGVDSSLFESRIADEANRKRALVPNLSANPLQFFDGLGQSVFDDETTRVRTQADNAIENFAGFNFDRKLIEDSADDLFLESIKQDRFDEARGYGDNLLARGVISDVGFAGGLEDLESQDAKVRRILNEIGTAQLDSGRSDLRTIASDARNEADNLRLSGSPFDEEFYRSSIDNSLQGFFDNLGSNLESFVPEDLFDTGDFANAAGAAQGAQNFAFDPSALAGFFEEEEEDDEEDENLQGFFNSQTF